MKPWMLQPDGDLWETFDNATRTKGVHAFRATWVKGHVTLQAMLDYPDIIPNAIDNGVADLVAPRCRSWGHDRRQICVVPAPAVFLAQAASVHIPYARYYSQGPSRQ